MFVNQSQEKSLINLRRLIQTAYAPHAAEKNVVCITEIPIPFEKLLEFHPKSIQPLSKGGFDFEIL